VTLAAGRTGTALAGALATVAVARILGPAGAGGYAIAISAIVVLTGLSTLGIEHGIVYYVSSRRWDAHAAFRSAQGIALGAGLLGAAVGLGVRLGDPAAFARLSVSMTAVVVLALPFALSWYYASFVALATDHFEGYAAAPLLQSLAALILIVALSATAGLWGALIAVAAAHVIAAVGMLALAPRWLARAPAVDPAEARTLRRAAGFGVRGYAANALTTINYRLDFFILSAVAHSSAVGRYAVAVAVTQTLWLVPPAVSDLVFTRVAALTAGEGEDAAATQAMVEAKGIRHTIVIVAVTAALVAFGLIFLVVPVFGSEFAQSVHLGLILLPGVTLAGFSGVLSSIIVGRGKPVYMLRIALITTPATIALYLLLIPSLGAVGAALASTLSYTGSFALAVFSFGRVTGRSLARIAVPTRDELEDYRRLLRTLLVGLTSA
jgi:O-antigen/teichoic acid export membrane protein